jgi:hypothetical protein
LIWQRPIGNARCASSSPAQIPLYHPCVKTQLLTTCCVSRVAQTLPKGVFNAKRKIRRLLKNCSPHCACAKNSNCVTWLSISQRLWSRETAGENTPLTRLRRFTQSTEYDQGKARYVTVTREHEIAFGLLSDTQANGRYEALVVVVNFVETPVAPQSRR